MSATQKKTRPVAGGLWGLLLGLGLALLAVDRTIIDLAVIPVVVVVVVGIVLGVLWGLFGPASRARDVAGEPVEPTEPVGEA